MHLQRSFTMKTIAVLTVLLCAAAFCGCTGEDGGPNTRGTIEQEGQGGSGGPDDSGNGDTDVPVFGNHEGLSAETERQIRQDYLRDLQSAGAYPELTVADVWIKKYYGEYNGAVAVMMDAKDMAHTGEARDVRIQASYYDVVIRYNDGNSIVVWKDGQFYGLEAAYKQKLVSESNLLRIANEHHGLDNETELQMEQEFFDAYGKGYGEIWGYYGTYNGCVAVQVGAFQQEAAWVLEVYVAGTNFGYPTANEIHIWKPGGHLGRGPFFPLQEAYYAGLLTVENVRNIAERYWAGRPLDEWPEKNYKFIEAFRSDAEEMERRVKQEYVDRFYGGQPQTVWIEECLNGIHNGDNSMRYSAIRVMNELYHCTSETEEIIVAGSLFRYPVTNVMFFWGPLWPAANSSPRLYDLQEAYDAGILKQSDVDFWVQYYRWKFWCWY